MIGLIGVGYWGKNLVRVFNRLGVLRVVCDIDKGALEQIKIPGVETVSNFSEILNNKEIKAVGIATPASTHYEFVKKALLAKKDVFVEKPLALEVEQGKELVELAEKNELILAVGHLLLYHPAIIKLKELINQGQLGEIRYICSNRLNFGKFRREENVLWSFAPHDISVILYITEKMPKRVRTVGKSYLIEGIPDIILSFLEFEDNKAAQVYVSWLNPFKEQMISVIGDKAMAVFDGVKNELRIYNHKIDKHQAVKAEAKKIETTFKEPLIVEAEEFLRCVEERGVPRSNGREALKVLKVLNMCQQSIEKNGEFIE